MNIACLHKHIAQTLNVHNRSINESFLSFAENYIISTASLFSPSELTLAYFVYLLPNVAQAPPSATVSEALFEVRRTVVFKAVVVGNGVL